LKRRDKQGLAPVVVGGEIEIFTNYQSGNDGMSTMRESN